MRRRAIVRTSVALGAAVAVVALLLRLPTAQAAATAAATPTPFRVASWNVCAEFSGCPATDDAGAAGKVATMAKLINDHDLDAVMFQEICEWHVSQLLTQLGSGWKSSFQAMRQNDTEGGWPGGRIRMCRNGRGAQGIALVVKGGFDQEVSYRLPSPTVRYSMVASMLCVRMRTPVVRLCTSHFTPSSVDTTQRAPQLDRALSVLGSFGADRVVFGGDLNTLPPSGSWTPPSVTLGGSLPLMNSAYARYAECDQQDGVALTGAPRAGESTAHWIAGDGTLTWGKVDYLFATPNAADPTATFTTCDAISHIPVYQQYSDHLPLFGYLNVG